jgi:uncharacterized membrane protein
VAADPQSRDQDIGQIEALLAQPDSIQSSAATTVSPDVIDVLKDATTTAISSAYWAAAAVLVVAAVVAGIVLRRVRAADAEAETVGPALG